MSAYTQTNENMHISSCYCQQ